MQLDDLDFADDLTLLSQSQQQIQETTTIVAAASAVCLNINKGTSKILRYNTACNNQIKIDGADLEDVKTLTYLGSIMDEHGGSDADVKARIGKARAAYLQLKNIWNSKQLSTNTPRSELSIQISRQFYCMGRKPGELRKPSSRRYRSIDKTLSTIAYYGREQTRSQRTKKLGRSAGSG
ncbi:unnamed protein product [Schistosoma curassoni]|uniref:Reverse transcriptase domain-containing protein n=1 Tax=Schistosoma curassoni TaxID=6186 RepID=A0A183KCF0_9TREM|nr:unnamed protein product [Schistosoma curassoni]